MNSSFLYHAWGLYHHKCLREEYKGNTIILHIESKQAPKCYPQCGHAHLVKNGFRTRDFISLPIGGKKVILRMKVRRYKCKCADCDYDCRERIAFAPDSHSYTRRFAISDESYFFALRRGVGRGSTSAKILTTRRASARCSTSRM